MNPDSLPQIKDANLKQNSSTSPITGQNQSPPKPDPRFPTLDAQPKPQNTPPDNKNQG